MTYYKFIPVTKHFGYIFEPSEFFHKCLYIIYSVKKGKISEPVTVRFDKIDAIRECRYLEKLNARRWKD